MDTKDLMTDVALVGAAGYGAAKVMDRATTLLYEQQPDEAKEQEEDVSYGVAYDAGAQRTARLLGTELSEDEAGRAGMAIHYVLSFGWVPVYMVLRRRLGMTALGAGAAAGLSMGVLVDEIGNPLLRSTPPPQESPLRRHVSGLVGHLVYGLTVAALVEAGWKATGRRPPLRHPGRRPAA